MSKVFVSPWQDFLLFYLDVLYRSIYWINIGEKMEVQLNCGQVDKFSL